MKYNQAVVFLWSIEFTQSSAFPNTVVLFISSSYNIMQAHLVKSPSCGLIHPINYIVFLVMYAHELIICDTRRYVIQYEKCI
jgi:hypothetical protein